MNVVISESHDNTRVHRIYQQVGSSNGCLRHIGTVTVPEEPASSAGFKGTGKISITNKNYRLTKRFSSLIPNLNCVINIIHFGSPKMISGKFFGLGRKQKLNLKNAL